MRRLPAVIGVEAHRLPSDIGVEAHRLPVDIGVRASGHHSGIWPMGMW